MQSHMAMSGSKIKHLARDLMLSILRKQKGKEWVKLRGVGCRVSFLAPGNFVIHFFSLKQDARLQSHANNVYAHTGEERQSLSWSGSPWPLIAQG